MKPNYRLDQIGSLTRPAPLLDARDAYAAGKIGLTELRQAEDEAILAALRMQKKVGQNIFTDGEFHRDAGKRTSCKPWTDSNENTQSEK